MVWNQSTLLARVGEDRELLRELIGIFLEDCPRCVEEIRDSVRDRDARQLKLNAHLLAGTASHFGAGVLSETARRLEVMGKSGELTGASEVCEELVVAADELLPLLRELAC